jgi:rRNA maturation RNase YbeY
MAIHFHTADIQVSLKEKRRLKNFLKLLISSEGYALQSLDYIFCSDNYLLDINQRHLNHDTLTDIITFPFSKPNDPIVAEIYISYPRVIENADRFNEAINRELHRVIFHGILHLVGYKDKTASQKAIMRVKEAFYLNLYFSAVPRETN